MNNNDLPEYISGIPTAKNRSRERRNLIANYYSNLWKKLQREGKKNMIFNDYLGVNVYIVENESDKKTINAASKNWQSTYAVKHLYNIVINAAGSHSSRKLQSLGFVYIVERKQRSFTDRGKKSHTG